MRSLSAAWHKVKYEALMRRARLHTDLAGHALQVGDQAAVLSHQVEAGRLIGLAHGHVRRADTAKEARRG